MASVRILVQKTANGFIVSPPFDGNGGVELSKINVIEGHNYEKLFAFIYREFEFDMARVPSKQPITPDDNVKQMHVAEPEAATVEKI
jgi:hypothetical protein